MPVYHSGAWSNPVSIHVAHSNGTTLPPLQSCATGVVLGSYTSIGMLGWLSLPWSCLLVTFAKWDPDPVNVLTDLAESRRSIQNNTLAFTEQTESQERDVVVNCSYAKVLSVQNQNFGLDNSGQPTSGSWYWISIKLGNMWVSLDLMQVFPHCQMALIRKIFWFRKVHVKGLWKV